MAQPVSLTSSWVMSAFRHCASDICFNQNPTPVDSSVTGFPPEDVCSSRRKKKILVAVHDEFDRTAEVYTHGRRQCGRKLLAHGFACRFRPRKKGTGPLRTTFWLRRWIEHSLRPDRCLCRGCRQDREISMWRGWGQRMFSMKIRSSAQTLLAASFLGDWNPSRASLVIQAIRNALPPPPAERP